MEYILADKDAPCFICEAAASRDDRKTLVAARGKTALVILNRFPYSNGHLLVAPMRHVEAIEKLDGEEMSEIMSLVVDFKLKLDRIMQPQGYNLGLNLGKASGAGLEEHLHVHIVPRWTGDTNFMAVLGEAKIIPQHLEDTWEKLVEEP